MQPDAGPGGLAVLVLAREGDHVHSVFLVEEEKTHLQGPPTSKSPDPQLPQVKVCSLILSRTLRFCGSVSSVFPRMHARQPREPRLVEVYVPVERNQAADTGYPEQSAHPLVGSSRRRPAPPNIARRRIRRESLCPVAHMDNVALVFTSSHSSSCPVASTWLPAMQTPEQGGCGCPTYGSCSPELQVLTVVEYDIWVAVLGVVALGTVLAVVYRHLDDLGGV